MFEGPVAAAGLYKIRIAAVAVSFELPEACLALGVKIWVIVAFDYDAIIHGILSCWTIQTTVTVVTPLGSDVFRASCIDTTPSKALRIAPVVPVASLNLPVSCVEDTPLSRCVPKDWSPVVEAVVELFIDSIGKMLACHEQIVTAIYTSFFRIPLVSRLTLTQVTTGQVGTHSVIPTRLRQLALVQVYTAGVAITCVTR